MLSRLPRPSLTQLLLLALILLQFPLWFGQGGWIRVWRLERQIEAKHIENDAKRLRVAELEGEVRDFKKSPRAAEERARYELGMIMPGERFVQWAEPARPAVNAGSVVQGSQAGARP
ncbi:MAG: cell division protein FtsB [Burkholderiaceae bacterium]|nr:cell division protein FtsB [Burkholderiaceae bacterium]